MLAREGNMKIVYASDSSLLLGFGDAISPTLHSRVISLFHALQARNHPGIRNLHPGYSSLLIDFDPLQLDHKGLAALVEQMADHPGPSIAGESVVTIPVCYDAELGPDLPDIAVKAGIASEEVIRLHSSAEYLVCFLGFTPGFAYLGGMPETLHTPRLPTPRKTVAAGSVGIAGSQTGIYPVSSPGGWRLIGRTPLRMFNPESRPPTLLQPGDRVKFTPIHRRAFDELAAREWA